VTIQDAKLTKVVTFRSPQAVIA
jgi:vacuolar protein sorting-associated protein 13A/C